MASLITVRLETDNNVNIKVVGADRKTIKMLSFSRAAYSIVKQKYIEDSEFYADYNLSRSGVYILINDDGNTIYIGQSDNLQERLNRHYNSQDKTEYWINTMTFTSDVGNALNISQIKYIEAELIRLAQSAAKVNVEGENTFILKNKQNGNPPNMSVNDKIAAINFLEDILLITKALGITYFEERKVVEKAKTESEDTTKYYLKNRYAEGTMIIDGDKFVVLKGSKARKDNTESCHQFLIDKKNLLIKNGLLIDKGDYYITAEDIEFDSASSAAGVLKGSSTNGRKHWKDKEGKTLKDLGL